MLINTQNDGYNFLIGRIIRYVPKLYTSESSALLIITLDELCSMLVTDTNAGI